MMETILRSHAEQEFAEELQEMEQADTRFRPPNWRLSPWAVATYVLGGTLDNGFEIKPKYIPYQLFAFNRENAAGLERWCRLRYKTMGIQLIQGRGPGRLPVAIVECSRLPAGQRAGAIPIFKKLGFIGRHALPLPRIRNPGTPAFICHKNFFSPIFIKNV